MDVEEIKSKLLPKKKESVPIQFLSTGSAVLNCALSGRTDGGFPCGTVNVFAGDSRSGKTLITYNTLAEASINPVFKDYLLIYDSTERRMFWEIEKLWGPKLAKRIQPPRKDKKGADAYSRTIQEFYFNLREAQNVGKPFIWIEDSITNLYSVADLDKLDENKGLYEKGKEMTGTYGMSKAKANSDWLRMFIDYISESGSILVLINQSRDRIKENAFDFGPEQTYAGGRTQKFAAAIEMWSGVAKRHTKKVGQVIYEVGSKCRIQVSKNSVNGKNRTVHISVYDDVGLDDLGTCVDWLVDVGHWKFLKGVKGIDGKEKESQVIDATELGLTGKRDGLVEQIEAGDMAEELHFLVQTHWDHIESLLAMKRKNKYQV